MRSSSSPENGLQITGLRAGLLSAPYEPGEAPEWSAGVLPTQVATLIEVLTDSGLSGLGGCQAGVVTPNPLVSEFLVEPFQRDRGVLQAPASVELGVRLPEYSEERFRFRPGSGYQILAR